MMTVVHLLPLDLAVQYRSHNTVAMPSYIFMFCPPQPGLNGSEGAWEVEECDRDYDVWSVEGGLCLLQQMYYCIFHTDMWLVCKLQGVGGVPAPVSPWPSLCERSVLFTFTGLNMKSPAKDLQAYFLCFGVRKCRYKIVRSTKYFCIRQPETSSSWIVWIKETNFWGCLKYKTVLVVVLVGYLGFKVWICMTLYIWKKNKKQKT